MKKKTFEEGFDKGRKFMKLVMTKEFERELEKKERLIGFLRNELYLTRYENKIEIIDLGEVK
jgi:hypothetical protein